MGKDIKIKHSALPPYPPKYGGLFFLKKLCMDNKLFWANLWGIFYMRTDDQIMQRGRNSFTNAFSSNLNTVDLRIFPVNFSL